MGRIKSINQPGTLVDQVVSHIQTEIAQDRLRANQKISENQIAKQLRIAGELVGLGSKVGSFSFDIWGNQICDDLL